MLYRSTVVMTLAVVEELLRPLSWSCHIFHVPINCYRLCKEPYINAHGLGIKFHEPVSARS